MTDYRVNMGLGEAQIHEQIKQAGAYPQVILELTARCNNNCRHCYINRRANDADARANEMSYDRITGLVDEFAESGSLWCMLTGGEPLLREDFAEIYRYIHRKGLLVELFTNAALITDEHVRLFREHQPRDVEITVYGATEQTYESISRKPGSFAAFMRGLNRLFDAGIKVRLKAVIMRSNLHEFDLISEFCRAHTKDYYRFDPVLHLRYDRDPARNAEIVAERLTPDEVASLDRADGKRHTALLGSRDTLAMYGRPKCSFPPEGCGVFGCGIGVDQIVVGPDGTVRACQDLFHPSFVTGARPGTIVQDFRDIISRVRALRSARHRFRTTCHVCPLVNLCLWCPARAHLEHGELDMPVDYFCEVAHARASVLDADASHATELEQGT